MQSNNNDHDSNNRPPPLHTASRDEVARFLKSTLSQIEDGICPYSDGGACVPWQETLLKGFPRIVDPVVAQLIRQVRCDFFDADELELVDWGGSEGYPNYAVWAKFVLRDEYPVRYIEVERHYECSEQIQYRITLEGLRFYGCTLLECVGEVRHYMARLGDTL